MPKPYTNARLMSKVNGAYGQAAQDCNGPAMHILGSLHRDLVKIQEGQGSPSVSDMMDIAQKILY